jgi:toxin HigB-1
MIKSFKNKGIKKLFEKGDPSGVNPSHIPKLKRSLFRLDKAVNIKELDVAGYRLHEYKNQKDLWSVDVSGNYRILFEFKDRNVYLVDYLDPH